jgi:hypothetical protein
VEASGEESESENDSSPSLEDHDQENVQDEELE